MQMPKIATQICIKPSAVTHPRLMRALNNAQDQAARATGLKMSAANARWIALKHGFGFAKGYRDTISLVAVRGELITKYDSEPTDEQFSSIRIEYKQLVSVSLDEWDMLIGDCDAYLKEQALTKASGYALLLLFGMHAMILDVHAMLKDRSQS